MISSVYIASSVIIALCTQCAVNSYYAHNARETYISWLYIDVGRSSYSARDVRNMAQLRFHWRGSCSACKKAMVCAHVQKVSSCHFLRIMPALLGCNFFSCKDANLNSPLTAKQDRDRSRNVSSDFVCSIFFANIKTLLSCAYFFLTAAIDYRTQDIKTLHTFWKLIAAIPVFILCRNSGHCSPPT